MVDGGSVLSLVGHVVDNTKCVFFGLLLLDSNSTYELSTRSIPSPSPPTHSPPPRLTDTLLMPLGNECLVYFCRRSSLLSSFSEAPSLHAAYAASEHSVSVNSTASARAAATEAAASPATTTSSATLEDSSSETTARFSAVAAGSQLAPPAEWASASPSTSTTRTALVTASKTVAISTVVLSGCVFRPARPQSDPAVPWADGSSETDASPFLFVLDGGTVELVSPVFQSAGQAFVAQVRWDLFCFSMFCW